MPWVSVSVDAFSVSSISGRSSFYQKIRESGRLEMSYNPIDRETAEERDARMALVRGLQQSFYKDEEGAKVPELVIEDAKPDSDSSIIQNLPLWRSKRTEFPGSQHVLNIHVPADTNMFQKILKGQSKEWREYDKYRGRDDDIDFEEALKLDGTVPRYFGHILISGDSDDPNDPAHTLKEGDIGTLMKISDSRQQKNGQMTLVVQALEKFVIKNIEQSQSPYAIVDVAILPDSEQLLEMHPDTWNTTTTITDDNEKIQTAREAAAKYALANHFFEYKDVSIDECETTGECEITTEGEVVGMAVSPFSNYDPAKQSLIPYEELELRTQSNPYRDLVAIAESDAWIQLDELLTLLKLSGNGVEVPVPSQLLGLLPVSRSVLVAKAKKNTAIVEKAPWPENFRIKGIVKDMKGFVIDRDECNVDGEDDSCDFFEYTMYYSPLRRAQRLSYMMWTWIDAESIDLPSESNGKDRFNRESILKIESTWERLELATEMMSKICQLLRKQQRGR